MVKPELFAGSEAPTFVVKSDMMMRHAIYTRENVRRGHDGGTGLRRIDLSHEHLGVDRRHANIRALRGRRDSRFRLQRRKTCVGIELFFCRDCVPAAGNVLTVHRHSRVVAY